MLTQAAERFSDMVEGLKRMSSEMQRELEATRAELRKGILELPQETAESAAQMRRVIVDQIEALAELNRIVARHGRGLDAAEPTARRVEAIEAGGARRGPSREETMLANGGPRPEPPASRGRDVASLNPPVTAARRADSPSLSPAQNGGRSGWLSDLLTRASQDAEPVREAPRDMAPETPRLDERMARQSIESL